MRVLRRKAHGFDRKAHVAHRKAVITLSKHGRFQDVLGRNEASNFVSML